VIEDSATGVEAAVIAAETWTEVEACIVARLV